MLKLNFILTVSSMQCLIWCFTDRHNVCWLSLSRVITRDCRTRVDLLSLIDSFVNWIFSFLCLCVSNREDPRAAGGGEWALSADNWGGGDEELSGNISGGEEAERDEREGRSFLHHGGQKTLEGRLSGSVGLNHLNVCAGGASTCVPRLIWNLKLWLAKDDETLTAETCRPERRCSDSTGGCWSSSGLLISLGPGPVSARTLDWDGEHAVLETQQFIVHVALNYWVSIWKPRIYRILLIVSKHKGCLKSERNTTENYLMWMNVLQCSVGAQWFVDGWVLWDPRFFTDNPQQAAALWGAGMG